MLQLTKSVYTVNTPNGITLGKTKTDSINQMITMANFFFNTKYAIERHLVLFQFGSV